MLFLQFEDPKADIHLYINSPGGSVTAGLAIYDTMQFVTCDVATYCIGQAASMGAVLLTAGAKGKRQRPAQRADHDPPAAGRHGRHGRRHHDPRQGVHARSSNGSTRSCSSTPARRWSKIEQDTDRDRFMSADEALEYG